MSDKMREAFEKWAVSEGMPITRGHYYDVYASGETRAAYLAWQAAQSVPVEDVVLPIANAYESGIGHCNDNLCNPYREGSAEAFAYDYGKEFGKARGVSQSVPVMGEPVAFLNECLLKLSHPVMPYVSINEPVPDRDWRISPLYKAPTNYIPAAELERLRKDAERYRWIKLHANVIEWHLQDEDGTRLHERPTLDADIDRAMVAK